MHFIKLFVKHNTVQQEFRQRVLDELRFLAIKAILGTVLQYTYLSRIGTFESEQA